MLNFDDPFLENDTLKLKLESIRHAWDMEEEEFMRRIKDWFENFNGPSEKELAFKIIENIRYYSYEKLRKEIDVIVNKLTRILEKQQRQLSDLLLIVPDERGDSSDMLAYFLSKSGIRQSQIKVISDLKQVVVTERNLLVAFNDTHGTGNQFVNSILKCLKPVITDNVLYVVGITITDKAIQYLRSQLPHVEIISASVPKSAAQIFSHQEYILLEDLCGDVYPPHPLGYGDTGLLTAYFYQCPNNTLPIIWANHKTGNNRYEGYAFPWNPLFEYKPKVKEEKIDPGKDSKPGFTQKTKLYFDENDLRKINEIIDGWHCSRTTQHNFIPKLDHWFDNFTIKEKGLALKLLSRINYLSLARTRDEIRILRNKVMGCIHRNYIDDSKSDLLVVLTGDDSESSYHYVFDFLRIWHLNISQAMSLEYLLKNPYEAVGKHLIYFYHTRIHKGETFVTKIWNPERKNKGVSEENKLSAKDLPAKTHHVLSFMLSGQTQNMLEKIRQDLPHSFFYHYSDELSKTVGEIFTQEDIVQLKSIYERKNVSSKDIEKKFMTSYYFNCPKDTLSLLWYDKFNPLFQSRK